MGLTAEEIVEYPLKQTVRGYSVKEVDELLDRAADTIEALRAERDALRERATRAEERLDEVAGTEETLKRALVTAQEAAERCVQQAEEEASAILAEAREEADRLREEATREAEEAQEAARSELAALRERLEELRRLEGERRHRLREYLEEHLALLDRQGQVPSPTPAPTEATDGGPGPEAATAGPAEEPDQTTSAGPDDDLRTPPRLLWASLQQETRRGE